MNAVEYKLDFQNMFYETCIQDLSLADASLLVEHYTFVCTLDSASFLHNYFKLKIKICNHILVWRPVFIINYNFYFNKLSAYSQLVIGMRDII